LLVKLFSCQLVLFINVHRGTYDLSEQPEDHSVASAFAAIVLAHAQDCGHEILCVVGQSTCWQGIPCSRWQTSAHRSMATICSGFAADLCCAANLISCLSKSYVKKLRRVRTRTRSSEHFRKGNGQKKTVGGDTLFSYCSSSRQ
jgi:hypothetical protein